MPHSIQAFVRLHELIFYSNQYFIYFHLIHALMKDTAGVRKFSVITIVFNRNIENFLNRSDTNPIEPFKIMNTDRPNSIVLVHAIIQFSSDQTYLVSVKASSKASADP